MNAPVAGAVRFGPDGLVPVVTQDAVTGDVLMLAFMNDEALRLTQETGFAHYFSRGRSRIWRKGETSGNTQVVDEILVNCEQNSLLLRVRQRGAVCHEGYATCYFRRIEPDGTLTAVRERDFDPAAVYGVAASPHPASRDVDPLAEATRRQFAAYAYLRDHDLTSVSGTSARLRKPDLDLGGRIADELRELAGVLAGEHRHDDLASDARLEASQVIYWLLLQVLREGVTWSHLRPDRALATSVDDLPVESMVRLLRAEADGWASPGSAAPPIAARAHATLALVAQACRIAGVEPLAAVEADLAELRQRPYLHEHFETV